MVADCQRQALRRWQESRCSLLSLMQIKKTTPREENTFSVSFSVFSFIFNTLHYQKPLRLLLITYTINTLKISKMPGRLLSKIHLFSPTHSQKMPGAGGEIKICNDNISMKLILEKQLMMLWPQSWFRAPNHPPASFHMSCFSSTSHPPHPHTPSHTHTQTHYLLLHRPLNNATFTILKLFST